MPASVPIDPRESMRAQLVSTLRMMRERQGLSQDRLAKELYATREAVAAYESQRNRPDEHFCRKLDEFFGTGSMFQGLWFHAQREHLHEWFEAYVSHETEATEIRTFQPLYIPGLLQTEAYMRAGAILSNDPESVITQRLARREILSREHPPYLFAVLDQAAVRRPIGGVDVMAEQLEHLLVMSEQRRIYVQVVRERDGWYHGLDGALITLKKPENQMVGYVEAQFGGRLIENPIEVAKLAVRFDEIRSWASSEADSRNLIRETMEAMTDGSVAEE
jgi:DNA-binding XRE family transcriptional regulator